MGTPSNHGARERQGAGCPSFDASDETAEWATDYVWWPDDRYVDLAGIGVSTEGDYTEMLAETVTLVEGLAPWSEADIDGVVAVGFDDGDSRVIWPTDESPTS